jgi:hypothetical protein
MPIIQAAATYPSYAAIGPNPPSDGIGVSKQRAVPPGLRLNYHPSYYAAFLTDPAGNRIEAVCHTAGDI